MERIPASERTRERLKALIEGKAEAIESNSDLACLAARLVIEEALESEAGDALGRDYYVRGAAPGAGYRNGYQRGRLKSAGGSIEDSASQIADHDGPFRSRFRALLGKRTGELEAMAAKMYARDLSLRNVEAVSAEDGPVPAEPYFGKRDHGATLGKAKCPRGRCAAWPAGMR